MLYREENIFCTLTRSAETERLQKRFQGDKVVILCQNILKQCGFSFTYKAFRWRPWTGSIKKLQRRSHLKTVDAEHRPSLRQKNCCGVFEHELTSLGIIIKYAIYIVLLFIVKHLFALPIWSSYSWIQNHVTVTLRETIFFCLEFLHFLWTPVKCMPWSTECENVTKCEEFHTKTCAVDIFHYWTSLQAEYTATSLCPIAMYFNVWIANCNNGNFHLFFFIQEKLLNTKKYFHDLYTIYQ